MDLLKLRPRQVLSSSVRRAVWALARPKLHVKHRHPEIHLGSGIPFSRREHSLHGLPHCRFCRQQLFDFASLRKHIASGTCQVLKSAAARKVPVTVLWQEILDREQTDPPTMPTGLPEVDCGGSAEWLDAPILDVLADSRLLHRARRTCLLCGQRLIGVTRMRTHWRASHAVAWSLTESYTPGACAVYQLPFRQHRAKSAEARSKQCYVTFQILAVRQLHQLGRLSEMQQTTDAVKKRQNKANPAYASFDVKSTPIGRATGG